MNHDYCHCLDFTYNCPRICFRAQLERELKSRGDLIGIPITYSHLRNDDICPLKMVKEDKRAY